MAEATIVVLEGDQTGQELLEEALRVLDPAVIGIALELRRYDLSLESRRRSGNAIVIEAAEAMREAGFGLKAATITPEGADDVGSPNRLIREADRRQGDRADRAAHSRGDAGGRDPSPDLGGAHGGRGRLRRRAVAPGRGR